MRHNETLTADVVQVFIPRHTGATPTDTASIVVCTNVVCSTTLSQPLYLHCKITPESSPKFISQSYAR